MKAKYKRILLKISGEALSGTSGHGFDSASLKSVAEQIKKVVELGVETGVVVGGGNIFWKQIEFISGAADRVSIWTELPPIRWECSRP